MVNIILYKEYIQNNPDKIIDIEAKTVLTGVIDDLLDKNEDVIKKLINRFGENYNINLDLVKDKEHFTWFKENTGYDLKKYKQALENSQDSIWLVLEDKICIGFIYVCDIDNETFLYVLTFKSNLKPVEISVIEYAATFLLDKYKILNMAVQVIYYNNRYSKMGFKIIEEFTTKDNTQACIIQLTKENYIKTI